MVVALTQASSSPSSSWPLSSPATSQSSSLAAAPPSRRELSLKSARNGHRPTAVILSEELLYHTWERIATDYMEREDHWGYPVPLLELSQAVQCSLEALLSFLNQTQLQYLKWIPYHHQGLVDVGAITFHSPGLARFPIDDWVDELEDTLAEDNPDSYPHLLQDLPPEEAISDPTDQPDPDERPESVQDTIDPESFQPKVSDYDYDIYDYDLSCLPNTPPAGPLTQRQLSEITGIPTTTLHVHKTQPDFPEWIRQRSPQGFVYRYCEEEQLFYSEESWNLEEN